MTSPTDSESRDYSQNGLTPIIQRFPWLARWDSQVKEIVYGTAAAFGLKLLGTILGFAFNVLLARLLGAEGVGIYYLALTVTGIASVLGRLGLDKSLLRFSAANAAQGGWIKVAGVYRKGVCTSVAASVVVTALVLGNVSWIARVVFSEAALAEPLALMALGIIPMTLVSLHGALLKGLRKIGDGMLVESVGVPLIGLPLLVVLAPTFGTIGAVSANVLSHALVLILGILLWRRATPELRGLAGDFDTRYLITTSLPLFWIAVMDLILDRIDLILLGTWTSSDWVGIYGVARRTSDLTVFILIAVNSVLAPRFAALYAQRDYETLGTLARNTAKWMALLASPILFVFVLMPSWVLGVFGQDFTAGANVLAILAIGQFINVATGSVGLLLIMTGHEKLMRDNIVACTVLSVALYVVIVPRYGASGAALVKSITLAIMNLISVGLVYGKLSILTLPIPQRLISHDT